MSLRYNIKKCMAVASAAALTLALAGCSDPDFTGLFAQNQQAMYYAPQSHCQPRGYGGYGSYGAPGYGGYSYRPQQTYLPPGAPPFTGPFFGYGQGYAPPPGVRW